MAFKREADFTFIWKIENFSMLSQKKGDVLSSPSFDVEGLYDTEWLLEFYPKGKDVEDHFAIFLRRANKDGGPDAISIGYKPAILPADDNPEDVITKPVSTAEFLMNKGWGYKTFVKTSRILEKSDLYLPNDTLSLRCELWRDTPEKKTMKECVARTRINVERITHMWPINKFSLISAGLSNCVSVDIYKKVSMKLYWRTIAEEGEGEVAVENVYMQIVRTKQEKPTLLDANISVLDYEDKPQIVVKARKLFESATEDEKFDFLISKRKRLIEEDKDTFTPNDVLTLQCELVASDGVERSAIDECKYMSPPFQNSISDKSSLVEDLRSAYENEQFTDVTIRASGKLFPVHSVVLSARSEVFCKILEEKKSRTNKESNPEEENSENAASPEKVDDVDPTKVITNESDENNKVDDPAIQVSNDGQEKDSTIFTDKTSSKTNQDQESDSTISNNQNNETVSGNSALQAEKSISDNKDIDSTINGNQNNTKVSNSNDNGDTNGSQDNQIDSTIDGNGSKEDDSAKEEKEVSELITKDKNEDEEKDLESAIEDDQNKVNDSTKNDTADNSNADAKEDKLVQTDLNLDGLPTPKQDVEADVLDFEYCAETLQQLLDFFYTDEVGELDITSAKTLYCAAIRYKVAPLETKCLDFLRSSITVDNICDILEFADEHKIHKLKSFGQGFITSHMADILLSKQWQSFSVRKRHLAEETCRDLRNKRRKLDT